MSRRVTLWMVSVLLVVPSIGRASEFDWIARNVERETGCRQTHIPLFGLVRFAVGVTHPAGASQLNLAVFENADLEADRFDAILQNSAGASWKPIIHVRSRNGEATAIYAQADARHVRLLIGAVDHSNATLVQVRMNVGQLLRYIDHEKRP